MKRCPVCSRTFNDPYLSFCPNDGTPLVRMSPDEAHTVLMSPSREPEATSTPAPNPPPPPQPYSWANDTPTQWTPPPPPAIRGPATQQQTLAVASLILGLIGITFGWFCGGPFFAVLAVVLGIVAMFQIRKDPLHYGGKPMALAGLLLGGIVIVIYLVIMAIWMIMLIAGAVSN